MKRYTPFIVASLFLIVVTGVLYYLILQKNDGQFCYPLDDTFIHMAVAKNLVLHHTWGVNPGEWVSSSSSPLYTLLLAAFFKLFSIHLFIPFLLAFAGSFLIAWFLNKAIQQEHGLSTIQKTIAIIFPLALGVIPSLSLSGMEHTLQIAFTILFVFSSANTWLHQTTKNIGITIMAGAVMVGLRYENIFIVAAVCLLLLFNRKIRIAVIIGMVSVLFPLLFGIFFYLKKGFPIPNSVLIKGNNNINTIMGGQVAFTAMSGSLGGILIIAIILVYEKLRQKKYDKDFYILSVFILTVFMHSVFAQFGWFYRYEAYLIVLGSFQLLTMLLRNFSFSWLASPFMKIMGVFFILLCSNLFLRAFNATRKTPAIVHNIYDQQLQMGQFIKTYYPNARVAANDIGALCFYGNIYMLDMWGLASNEVTKARKGGYWNNDFLQQQVKSKNIELVIMYDSWFDRQLPDNWIKVASWTMPNNIICGDDDVSFYATNEASANLLKKNITTYTNQQLPKDNTAKFFY